MLVNLLNYFKRPVVVAMVAVGMMQASLNQIIHVVAMRDGRMAAIWAVNVFRRVFSGGKARAAFIRIGGINRNRMFVHMVAVRMMQMAVVEIVHVPLVLDGSVPAASAVDVRMVGMSRA